MMSVSVGGRPGMPVMGVTQSHMVTHGVITLLACSQEPQGVIMNSQSFKGERDFKFKSVSICCLP